jgi:type I restriction enzyme S subunit
MLKGYNEYKTTNYDWLPRIPSHWEEKTIRSITKLSDKRCGLRTDLELLSVYREYGVIKKKSRDDNHNVESENLANYKYVKKGNLVLNKMKMWQGSLGISGYDGIVSPAYIVCDLFTDANLRYLHFLLRSPLLKTFYNRVSYGIRVGQWDMHYADFKSLYIYFPSRPEQYQIVRYLDWKVSMISKYINAKKKQIEYLKERKQAIINQSVTKGLDLKVPMKDSGIEWLEKIPAHWDVRRLKTLINLSNKKEIENISQYIGLENIESWTGKRIITKNIEAQSVCNIFKKGNLLFGKLRPYLAKSWIAEYDGICSSEFLVMDNIKINPNYLHLLFMLKPFIFHIDSSTYGAKMPRANWDFIGNCKLPIPPHDEQEKISVFCQKNSSDIEDYYIKLQQQINVLQEYRTRLVSDVVTGKVNVQNVKVPEFDMGGKKNDDLSGIGQETEEEVFAHE